MRAENILSLAGAKSVELAGGKAASLSELISGGFKVPEGFVITSASHMKMSQSLENAILKSFDDFGFKLVAVRSSAVAEDGKNAAWAGQLDSFLNTDRGNLIENIKKCWDSASSTRAISYAQHKQIQSGNVAVIVQEMVPAEIAGVAFSVHPVTANHNQVVIEAVLGLGESLVAGQISPDMYVVDKKTQETLEKHIKKTSVLADADVKRIGKSVAKIEKLFCYPVDVEWAFVQNELYILQSRPITTLG